jgi:hypothetical protein
MLVPVGGGLSVRRVVAPTDVPATHAHPQMDPLATGAQVTFASVT